MNDGYIIITFISIIMLFSLSISIKNTLFLKKKLNEKINIVFSFGMFFLYIFTSFLTLDSLELLKTSGNTWGNSSLLIGLIGIIYGIFFFIFISFWKEKLIYILNGVFKIIIALISFYLIGKYGFGQSLEYVGKAEIASRWSTIIISIFFLIEGVLFITIASIEKKLFNKKL